MGVVGHKHKVGLRKQKDEDEEESFSATDINSLALGRSHVRSDSLIQLLGFQINAVAPAADRISPGDCPVAGVSYARIFDH